MKEKTYSSISLIPAALFCCLLWGAPPALIKIGYREMAIEGTPSILLFAGCRFMISGLMVLLFYLFSKHPKIPACFRSEGLLRAVFCLALFQTFGQYFFYYIGLAHTTGVIASILSGASAFFALILSALIYRLENMTWLKIISCLLGFAGILVMNLKGLTFSFTFAGEGMLLFSQVCSAESAVLIKIFSKKNDPVLLSGCQFLLGGTLLNLCGLISGGHFVLTWPGLLILLVLGFVSAGAYTLWGVLLSQYPVSRVGIFTCTIPLFGVVFSVLFLHEYDALTAATLIALILIIAGICLLNLPAGTTKSRKQKRKASQNKAV